ncbi:Trp biosynthesis-associated membrane protein [Corynebacterium sp. ES2794-CONJ1]|uniref:Trp biosynthesis-associated membrane protein n=1 Tax=unclassified Corynebacterium TaxID=2624378 RepID=UPI0021689D93|nr:MULTISPECIES: Trp biosynthesis-associated membrane protein [unclassified Corynebacterium]MCS4489052.1 Trp biosynthesis-associated membrane protein [Corynebacterium sp. ES2775-CONJ]MCS4490865.1 Trp biosynthesis-associated membrane protein [Corynebacterium sp. ES2715-CONJ3]MCS4531252.1 Trp biosynthesis-associated membrane protein [Corynebacterium sp. ES2730-CONJ]MCU9518621.1 Trp biosynthesis-associated membrane protein [Corynebacterium sp. ES2794-CONJ1]
MTYSYKLFGLLIVMATILIGLGSRATGEPAALLATFAAGLSALAVPFTPALGRRLAGVGAIIAGVLALISSNYEPLVIIGGLTAIGGGIGIGLRPGLVQRSSVYQRKSQIRDHLVTDLEDDPESSRLIWDALDAGIDPTDGDQPKGGKFEAS